MTHQPSKTVSAVRKLELSKLTPSALNRNGMGIDVDVSKFALYLSSQVKIDVVDRIVDSNLIRSIDQASTIIVTINDYDRALLTSGLLSSKLDVDLDGMWFRLAGVDKSGENLNLTFEQREISVLRNYTKWKIASRAKTTRAEFVLNLIREVKEFHIPVVIPELHAVQPIERFSGDTIGMDVIVQKGKGINVKTYGDNLYPITPGFFGKDLFAKFKRIVLRVKGDPASDDQIVNADIIIATGEAMGVGRKLIVCAVMTAITESVLHNVDHGDQAGPDSRGLFQQRDSWGSLADRMNPEASARMFYNHAIQYNKDHPGSEYWEICNGVQHPDPKYATVYGLYRTEAESFVNAYGVTGGDLETLMNQSNGMAGNSQTGGTFYFFRGQLVDHGKRKIRKPENSWTCIQRLADEVDYRAFFVGGTFYWISEDMLFKQRPEYVLTEFMDGITSMDGEYHMGKGNGSITVNARVGRWTAPPGTVIVMQDMGPWNGRWLVSDFSRSLYDLNAEITLKKPLPVLPEPLQGNEKEVASWIPQPDPAGRPVVLSNHGNSIAGYVNPLGTPMTDKSEFQTVDPEGAPDNNGVRHHAAKDWFAPGGSAVVAPTSGRIVEIKPSSGNSGQIFGGVVKLFEEVPNTGHIWVFRHVDPVAFLSVGETVGAGTKLATVTTWADNPAGSHSHIEIWRSLAGGYNYENMVDPVLYLRGLDK